MDEERNVTPVSPAAADTTAWIAARTEILRRTRNIATTGRPLVLEVYGLALGFLRESLHDSEYKRSDPARATVAAALARDPAGTVEAFYAAARDVAEEIGVDYRIGVGCADGL